MTDTLTAGSTTRTVQWGMLRTTAGEDIRAVQFDNGRFDWGAEDMLQTVETRYLAGEAVQDYGAEGWTFTPDTPVETDPVEAELSEPMTRAKLRALIVAKRDAAREVETLRERIQRLVQEAHAEISDPTDERLRPIWERAADAADENGFCPEYEKLCASLGIPGREKLWRSVVTMTFNAYVYIDAHSEEEAEEQAEQLARDILVERLETAQRYGSYSNGDVSHVNYENCEVSDTNVYE